MNEPYTITKDDLDSLGVTPQDIDALLTQLNDALDERVGAEITESLDDNELRDLLALQESGNDEAIDNFLAEHVPELEAIVSDHRAVILGEVAQNANDSEK